MSKRIGLRLIALLMSVSLLLSFAACKSSDGNTSDGNTSDVANTGSDFVNVESDDVSNKENTVADNSSKDESSSNKETSSKTESTIKIDPSKKKTSLTKEEVIAKMPKKLRGTTIKYAYWWDPKKQMEAEAIASFEKETGIKIEPVVLSYTDFYTQVAAMITAGKSPDIVRTIAPRTNNFELLQPITNSGFDFNDTAWSESTLKAYTLNGNTYAVNLEKSAVMDYAVIYYNKNALKAAEMEDPYTIWKKNPQNWTWSKFWEMCDEFVKANKKSSTTYYGATFEYPDAFVRAMGGCIYEYDLAKGKYVNKMTSNAMKVGWQRTLSAISKKWLHQGHDITLFDSGRALFFWSGPYSIRKGDGRQEALKKQNALGVVPLPTDSKNQTLYEFTAFGICKGAKNAEAAPYYLRWVLDQSSYDMNKIYATKEAADVMNYVSSQKNLWYGHYWYDAFFNSMYKGGANQVESVIHSYKNTVDMTVSKLNDEISLY